MDTVIEQVVKSSKHEKEKKRSRLFLILMIVFFVIFILLECFGLAVSQVYYYTDRELFWWFMLYFALAALPIVAFEIILFVLRRRLCVTFDYYFDGGVFQVIRSVDGKHKKYAVIFSADAVSVIGRVDSEEYFRAFPPGEKRKPVICALNIENPNIYFVKARIEMEGMSGEKVIVLEPKKELLDYLIFSCPRGVLPAGQDWVEKNI